MSKKKLFNTPVEYRGKYVAGVKYSSDSKQVCWRFDKLDMDGKFAFDLSRTDFNHREILDKIIAYSNMTWDEVKKQTHDRKNKSKHHFLDMDALSADAIARIRAKHFEDRYQDSIFSFAFKNRLRIIGIRDGEEFHVVWFDPNHEFCPSKEK